jgi:hypothetical protein
MSYTTFTAVPRARVDDGVPRESLATTPAVRSSGCHPQGGRRLQQRNGSVAVSGSSRCQRLRQGLSSPTRPRRTSEEVIPRGSRQALAGPEQFLQKRLRSERGPDAFDSVVEYRRGESLGMLASVSRGLFDPCAKPLAAGVVARRVDRRRHCLVDPRRVQSEDTYQ